MALYDAKTYFFLLQIDDKEYDKKIDLLFLMTYIKPLEIILAKKDN